MSDNNPNISDKISIRNSVYELVDSRIMFMEYQSQRLMKRIIEENENISGSPNSDSQPSSFEGSNPVDINDSDQFLDYLDILSRSIYWLEQFKSLLTSDNALDVFKLMDNNQFLKFSDHELEKILKQSKMQSAA
jgi:hypothetical protein